MLKNINLPFVFTIIILLILSTNSYLVINSEYNERILGNKYRMNACQNNEYCENQIDENSYNNCIKYCTSIIENPKDVNMNDAIYVSFEMLYQSSNMTIQVLGPILIGISAIWKFLVDLKSGNYKNKITRINYNKYIKTNWIKSLKFTLVIPLFILCVFAIGFIMRYNIPSNTFLESLQFWIGNDEPIIINLFLYIFIVFISFIAMYTFIINLFYICSYKAENIILSIIYSILSYFGLWLFCEWFIGSFIFENLFKFESVASLFGFADIWSLNYNLSIYFIFYYLALATISTIIVFKLYKNKEMVVIYNE